METESTYLLLIRKKAQRLQIGMKKGDLSTPLASSFTCFTPFLLVTTEQVQLAGSSTVRNCAIVYHGRSKPSNVACLTHAQGADLSVCAMAASNGHKSETTSSITTKRGIGMGSVTFSDVILLKSLSTKREARRVM